MRFLTTAALSAAALAGFSQATGNAVVTNQCPGPVYVWSVGSSISDMTTLNKGQSYTEQIHSDPKTGGIAIKITRDPNGLFDGAAQTVFAYTLTGPNVWYDASDVFGDAFKGYPVTLVPSDNACPSITWSDGVPPAGSETRECNLYSDLVFTLC